MEKNRFTFKVAYANDIAALIPEWWALEAINTLNEVLVMAPLVNRNYEQAFAQAGDIVHVNKAGTFSANNKVEGSAVTTQDLDATDTAVRLDQHKESTFSVSDVEIQQAPQNLFEYGLKPAIYSIAKAIDDALIGQIGLFVGNSAGSVDTTIDDAAVREVNRVMTANNNPTGDRTLVVGPNAESDLLGITRFTEANVTGLDKGVQLNGLIGQAMGFEVLQSQNISDARTLGTPTVAEAIGAAIEAKGQTTLTVASWTANSTAGEWLTIAGVPGMYQLTADASATDTTVTVFPALRGAAAAAAVITVVRSAGLAKGAHAQNAKHTAITVITDGYAAADDVPLAGDYLSFGAVADGTDVYMVTGISGTWASSATEMTLSLNRPIDTTIADNDEVNVLPQNAGMNFGFRPNALTLVNRPLAEVREGTGATSIEVNDGAISLRITVSYNASTMAYQVTVDTLLGVQVLDLAKGAVLLG